MGKMGRPQKPYQTSWGEVVPGLTKDTNGRWRIVTTGERFRELDERLAVLRFRRSLPNGTLFIPVARSEDLSDNADAADALNDQIEELHHIEHDDGSDEIGHVIDAAAGWNWFRQQLIERPEFVAKQTGIPQIASLHLISSYFSTSLAHPPRCSARMAEPRRASVWWRRCHMATGR